MNQLLESIANVLNLPEVPWIVAGLIVLYALASAITMNYLKIRPIRKLLDESVQAVEETPSDPNEFAKQFEEINQRLRENSLMRHAWSEFLECTILSARPLQNTRYPYEYFNDQTIVKPKINLRYYQAIPNLLIGSGLLFTFIGLVAALYFASKGLEAANTMEAQVELRKLLHAATFKFVTSIAGLFASLGFSWFEKHLLHTIHVKIRYFCRLLDERFIYVTQAAIAQKQLEESKKQTEQLERFNTDLAVSIAEALEQRLTPRLQEVFQPHFDAIRHVANNLNQMNQEALQSMIDTFNQQLQQNADHEMQSLRESLQGLADNLAGSSAQLHERLTTLMEALGGQVAAMEGALDTSAEQFTERISGAADTINQRVDESFELLHLAATDFHQGVNAMQQFVHAWNTLLEQTQLSLDALNNASENLDHASTTVADMLPRIEQLAATVNQGRQDFSDAREALEAAASSLQQTSTQVQQAWESYRQRFEQVDENAAGLFESINTGLQAFTNQVGEFVQNIDHEMAQALNSLSAAVQELNDIAEQLAQHRQG